MEVSNRRKIAYRKRNPRKVSVVLISKCPEPFAGVGYKRKRNLVMKKLQSFVITMNYELKMIEK